MATELTGANGWPKWWPAAAFGLLSAGYALQLLSPLRLNGDAVEYLWVAAALADGRPYVPVRGYIAPFPFGYPAVIAALDRLGVRGPAVIIGLNCLGLAVGVYFAYRVLRRELGGSPNAALVVSALTMLSWTFVKLVTLPMSDMVFFGTSMACLGALSAATESRGMRRGALLVAAAAMAFASLEVRRIGVALIPAWIAVGARGPLLSLVRAARRTRARRLALLTGVLLGVAAGAAVFLRTEYGQRLVEELDKVDLMGVVADIIAYRLTELGELALNAPEAKLPFLGVLFPIAGAIVIAGVVRGAWLRRRRWGAVDVYLGGYAAILAIWPFPETRLWLPVVPLLMGDIAVAVASPVPRFRRVLGAYVGVFCILGLAALAYSTRLSLAGDRFGDLYADGSLRRIYCPGSDSTVGVSGFELKGIAVLHRFQGAPSTR